MFIWSKNDQWSCRNKGAATRGPTGQAVRFRLREACARLGRKGTRGHAAAGEGEGGGSRRKKEGPSCWGPGCSGNDRQPAWHRVRTRASSPSGQGRCPSHPTPGPPLLAPPVSKTRRHSARQDSAGQGPGSRAASLQSRCPLWVSVVVFDSAWSS